MRAIAAKKALDSSLTPAAAAEAGDKNERLEACAEQRTSTATSIFTTIYIASARPGTNPTSQRKTTAPLSAMESAEAMLATPVDGGLHSVTATLNVAQESTVSLSEQLMIAQKRTMSECNEIYITTDTTKHPAVLLREGHITAAIFLPSTALDSPPIASAHKSVVPVKSGDVPESLSVSQKQQDHPATTASSQQKSKSSELDSLPPLKSDNSSITTSPSMSESCQMENQHCGSDRVTPQTFSSNASISVTSVTRFSEVGINHQNPSKTSDADIVFSSIPTFDSDVQTPAQTIIVSTENYQIPQDSSALVIGSQTFIPGSATTGKNQHISLPVSVERAFTWTSTYSLIPFAATESHLNPIDGKTVPPSIFSQVSGPSSVLASSILGPISFINPSSGMTAIQKSESSTSSTLNATMGLTSTAPLEYSGMAARGRTHLGYGWVVICFCLIIGTAMLWL